MIKVTINSKEIELEKPVTILEAAKMKGIKIPHFCHHSMLPEWGGCRMCLVEVEKMPKLQTACTLYVTDGMIVRTESDVISKARRAVLEFILINHPLDCPICDKAGECKLQDYVVQYGATAGRFKETKIRHPEGLKDPLIVRNPERCIMCTRCVRMCDGIQGVGDIAITKRGNHSTMEPFSGESFDCEYCGNCLTVCPVGAIMSRLHRYSYRAWQVTDEVYTICSFCGVGCTLKVQSRENKILRVIPELGRGVNKGILCNRGRFGYEYTQSKERLNTPLIKKNSRLTPVSWDTALEIVANKLKEVKDSYGGNAIAGIAGGRCTNEENYVFQKLLRGLGSNNIDSISRTGLLGARRIIEGALGSGVTANAISQISNSDVIFIIGGDPTQINPIMGLQIREAFKKGSKVLTIGYMPGLKRHSHISLIPAIYSETNLLAGILGMLMKEKAFPDKYPSLSAKIKSFKAPSIEDTISYCNIKNEDLFSIVSTLKTALNPAIIIGRYTMQRSQDIFLLTAIASLMSSRIYLMSERPNEHGLVDMGCVPDILAGELPIEKENLRRYEDVWGIRIPSEKGLFLWEMIEGAYKGSIKVMYIMGENPVFNLPDSNYVKTALSKGVFLITHDIFMSETAEISDIVLPALAWTEKDGTYTNLERRIQVLQKAIKREGMEDWRIISEIGKRIGLKTGYSSSEEIMEEIAKVSPLYANLTYKDIQKGYDLWPYKGSPPKLEFEFPELLVPEPKRLNGGLYLIVEKPLFHSGTLSRYTSLLSIYPEAVLKVNPITAEKFNLKDGDMANVVTDRGKLTLKTKIDSSVGESILVLSNNFRGKGALSLIGTNIDPVTHAPQVCAWEAGLQKE